MVPEGSERRTEVAAKKQVTEGDMYQLLKAKVCKDSGNGPQATLLPQVRNSAGFNATRTLDAVSLGFWPSRGMLLEGYEIKVSRSDWLRELKNAAKMEAFVNLLDRIWLVVADRDHVQPGELPEGWGLMHRYGNGLRVGTEAERLHPERKKNDLPPGFARHFLVPLLRAGTGLEPGEYQKIRDEIERNVYDRGKRAQEQLKTLQERLAEFTEASGVDPLGASWEYGIGSASARGAAFKVALEGEMELEAMKKEAARIERSALALAMRAAKIARPKGEKNE